MLPQTLKVLSYIFIAQAFGSIIAMLFTLMQSGGGAVRLIIFFLSLVVVALECTIVAAMLRQMGNTSIKRLNLLLLIDGGLQILEMNFLGVTFIALWALNFNSNSRYFSA